MTDPWSARLSTVDASWLSVAPPARDYLAIDTRTARGAIPSRGVALLVAAGGGGKSYAAFALAVAVATATAWLGVMRPASPGRVLVVSAEEPTDEIRTRIYHVARALGIKSLPAGSIDVIDVHDVHMPLLDAAAAPTDHARALAELARTRGPYALVVVDPLARISGASIDADNVAACALVTALETVATAAGGLVLGVHHTSQTARRAGLTDATASRGATGLPDSARMVMVLTVESIEHEDSDVAERLGEIVTITRAKANHIGRWDPIQVRRGEHGVLVPLDDTDRAMVAAARQSAAPSSARAAARQERGRADIVSVADTIREILRAAPEGLSGRALLAEVRARRGQCSEPTRDAAIAVLGGAVATRPGADRSTLHYLVGGAS